MGTQNKRSLSDKHELLILVIRIMPSLSFGLLAAVLGFQIAVYVPEAARVYFQVMFLGLVFTMIILDEEPGWNLVLFFCFGITAGMNLAWSVGHLFCLKSWAVFSSLILISFIGGILLKGIGKRVAGVLFGCAMLYVIGWIIVAYIPLPDLTVRFWIAWGLALFSLTLIGLIRQGMTRNYGKNAVPFSIRISAVIFNLYWLSGQLLS